MNQSSLSFSPATTSIAASTVTLINESSLTANNAKVNIINSNLVMDRGYMDLSYSNFYVSESSWFLYNSYIRAYRLDMSVMGGSQMEFVNVDGSLDIVNITTSDSCSIQWTDSHVGTNNFGGAYNITMAPNSHLQISNTNFNPKSLGGLIVISLGKNSTFSLNSNGTIKKNCTLFLSFTVPDGVVYTEHDVEQSMICYDAETPDFTTTMESSDMTKTSEISLSTIYSTVLTSTSTKNSTISSTTYSTNEPVKSTSSASIGTTRSTSTKTTQPPSTRTSGLASTSTSGMASTSTSGMASTSTSEMASTSTSEMVSTSTNGMASTSTIVSSTNKASGTGILV